MEPRCSNSKSKAQSPDSVFETPETPSTNYMWSQSRRLCLLSTEENFDFLRAEAIENVLDASISDLEAEARRATDLGDQLHSLSNRTKQSRSVDARAQVAIAACKAVSAIRECNSTTTLALESALSKLRECRLGDPQIQLEDNACIEKSASQFQGLLRRKRSVARSNFLFNTI